MPKVKATVSDLLRDLGSDFEAYGSSIMCKACSLRFLSIRRSDLMRHCRSKGHKESLQRTTNLENNPVAVRFGETESPSFNADLCRTLLEADIPLFKLKHPSFVRFIEKYTKNKCPDESTLRKNYTGPIYQKTLQAIRDEIGDSKIWVQIDETTDAVGRAVANVIVGSLDPNKTYQSFLLTSEVLPKANSETISELFKSALSLLWPSGIQYDRVLLYLSDAAAYMVKSGKMLAAHFPRVIHVTCIVHGLHRVAEEVRGQFRDVDALISNVKKIFLKCNSRVQLFKETLKIPLPPQPVITRWGTWIEAAMYYAANFNAVKSFVCDKLLANDAVSIREAQNLFAKINVHDDLLCITRNFAVLPRAIKKLEESGLTLQQSIEIYSEVESLLSNLEDVSLQPIRTKFTTVRDKNTGFSIMRTVLSMLKDESACEDPICIEQMSAQDLLCLTNAPLVTCEVERSFSRYKTIFRENRHRFKFENLKMILVISCNAI
jgi:hypothetical protein